MTQPPWLAPEQKNSQSSDGVIKVGVLSGGTTDREPTSSEQVGKGASGEFDLPASGPKRAPADP